MAIYQCNSVPLREYDKLRGKELGSGVFPTIARINHSCVPNAVFGELEPTEKDGDKAIELRAIKDISKGEEITVCYYTDVKEYGSKLKRKEGRNQEASRI